MSHFSFFFDNSQKDLNDVLIAQYDSMYSVVVINLIIPVTFREKKIKIIRCIFLSLMCLSVDFYLRILIE